MIYKKAGRSRDEKNPTFDSTIFQGFVRSCAGQKPLASKNFTEHFPGKKIEKRQHFFTFMEKVFQRGAAKIAQILEERQDVWYHLMFGVYHPKKPDQKH